MGGGGGDTSVTATPLPVQQKDVNNWETNQIGNYKSFVQNDPLLSTAQGGALNFWNQLTAPGGALSWWSDPALRTGFQNEAATIASGGAATPQQARDTNQATLANASAAGSAFSPNTLGQLALNEDSARQGRLNTAYGRLGSIQGLQTGAEGLATGGLNQLLGVGNAAVGQFTGLTNPILAYLSQAFGQQTQAQIANAQISAQQGAQSKGMIGDIIGGVAKVAGSAAMASDERIKKNIRDTGETTPEGVPLKTFQYRTRPGVTFLGVLAQDVERKVPSAVGEDPVSGIKFVDARRFPIIPISATRKAA